MLFSPVAEQTKSEPTASPAVPIEIEKPHPIPTSDTTMFSLAALVVICSGAAWGWLLVQFVQLFARPELDMLQEQIAARGFF